MKKVIIFFVVTFVLFACYDNDSISKKVTVPIGTIACEIDGQQRTFNFGAKAVIDTIPWLLGQNAVKLSISGHMTEDNNSENILIWFFVSPEKEIDDGTYPDLNKQIYQYLEFNNVWREKLYNYGSNRYVDPFYSSRSTIFQIDSLITGVFSGNVGIGAGAIGFEQPPLYHKIRNGQFNLILEK